MSGLWKEIEDTKGVIRIRKSKKNWQQSGQKNKQRSTKHTYKTKDRVIRTPQKIGDERRCSGTVDSSCSTSGTRRLISEYFVIPLHFCQKEKIILNWLITKKYFPFVLIKCLVKQISDIGKAIDTHSHLLRADLSHVSFGHVFLEGVKRGPTFLYSVIHLVEIRYTY